MVNKTTNHLTTRIIENKKDDDMWCWELSVFHWCCFDYPNCDSLLCSFNSFFFLFLFAFWSLSLEFWVEKNWNILNLLISYNAIIISGYCSLIIVLLTGGLFNVIKRKGLNVQCFGLFDGKFNNCLRTWPFSTTTIYLFYKRHVKLMYTRREIEARILSVFRPHKNKLYFMYVHVYCFIYFIISHIYEINKCSTGDKHITCINMRRIPIYLSKKKYWQWNLVTPFQHWN